MPNTPALIGQGIAGLFARDAVTVADRAEVEAVLAPTGRTLWVDREEDLDAVTALSGSGPAYVFYFVEAMMQAARERGLSDALGKALALATFAGASSLAQASDETPALLRERVTSMGGSTPAALGADMLAPVIDQAAYAWASSPLGTRLEQVCLGWLKELFGLPRGLAGVMTTGATMANFVALAAAVAGIREIV